MPINPATIAGGIGLASAGIGLLGGGKRSTEPAVPSDVQGIRGGQTNFLEQFMQALQSGNLEQFIQGSFGNIGVDQTANQKQASGGISQFLNQQSPEARALGATEGALTGIANQNSGQGIIDALQPGFERNLGLANQAGGRFGSANAVLRSRAVDDFNLLSNQALQQGQQNQISASQILGMLSGQAGQADFGRLLQQFGIGTQEAGQADIETQRRLGLGTGLFGQANQAAFNVPNVQNPSALEQFGGIAGNTAGIFNALGGVFGGNQRSTGVTDQQISGVFGGSPDNPFNINPRVIPGSRPSLKPGTTP